MERLRQLHVFPSFSFGRNVLGNKRVEKQKAWLRAVPFVVNRTESVMMLA